MQLDTRHILLTALAPLPDPSHMFCTTVKMLTTLGGLLIFVDDFFSLRIKLLEKGISKNGKEDLDL